MGSDDWTPPLQLNEGEARALRLTTAVFIAPSLARPPVFRVWHDPHSNMMFDRSSIDPPSSIL
jgi:hypothetical protein